MMKRLMSVVCVMAWASAAGAEPSSTDISGRWSGATYRLAANSEDCTGEGCNTLTLDIVPCATGWCGIEVGKADTCGGTALKLDAATSENGGTYFKGSLELAKGTEPYVVQAWVSPPVEGSDAETLEILGDTGGEFRMFRRSFPFSTSLVRAGDAVCKAEKPVS